MKLSVFGAGYVGLVTGACFAELGNELIIVDVDKNRVNNLNKGIIPIYEPGLSEMIKRNVSEKRLFFTLDSKKAVQESDVIFIAVGTPPKEDGSTDLSHVLSVAKTIGQNINEYKIIVDKSTVPVGTADKVKEEIKKYMTKKYDFDVVSNPEFLKEGSAIQDFMVPDRIVIGSGSEKATIIMKELYQGIVRVEHPLFVTDVKSSEIIKYASNAMLACRISFMNQLAPLCEKIGADIKDVATGIGMDKRIGSRFLQAGVGYGGSCFPKDVKSLAFTLKENGINSELIDAIENVNNRQKESIIIKLKKELKNLRNKKIAIWGLSYKPKTDDVREAPSTAIISELLNNGARITTFDPKAEKNAKKIFGNKIIYAKNIYDSSKDADCIILMTEWNEFRNPDWKKIKSAMKGNLIIDGRNIYESDIIREKGFIYMGVGRN